MDVSVCIVNWNTRHLLGACLRSLAERTRGVSFEVIVVDNASTDGSAEMVRQAFPAATLIASDVNLGFARGSNVAARAARGEFVLFLNPDTELVTDALTGMVACLRSDARIGAAGCRLLNADGSIQFTCAATYPTAANELCELLWLDRMFPKSRALSSRELRYWDHASSADVDCLSGACMMLRRELVERLGGFDERLFMYGEDLDLCCRIRAQGYRLRYVASESIFHFEGSGSRKRGSVFAPMVQRASNYYFVGKHFGRPRALAYRAAVSLGAAVRVVAAAAMGSLLWLARARRTGGASPDLIQRQLALLLWSIGLKKAPQR